jgi:hypothetical protein
LRLKDYMNFTQSLGCFACAKDGYPGTPAQLHHPRAEMGMSERAEDHEVIPLCIHHHLRPTDDEHRNYPDGRKIISIHDSREEFVALYGTEAEIADECRESIRTILKRSSGNKRA